MIQSDIHVPSNHHQLAVFVDVSEDINWERAHRFVGSLNHDKTIKADLFAVRFDGPVAHVQQWDSMEPSASETMPASELSKFAEGAGFKVVVMFATAGRTFS